MTLTVIKEAVDCSFCFMFAGTLLCSMKLSIIDALQRDKMLDEAAALTGNRTLCSMSRVEA